MNNYTVVKEFSKVETVSLDNIRSNCSFCEAVLPLHLSTEATYIVTDKDTSNEFHSLDYSVL